MSQFFDLAGRTAIVTGAAIPVDGGLSVHG